MSVVIETTLGDITVDLYVKERAKGTFSVKHKSFNFQISFF